MKFWVIVEFLYMFSFLDETMCILCWDWVSRRHASLYLEMNIRVNFFIMYTYNQMFSQFALNVLCYLDAFWKQVSF